MGNSTSKGENQHGNSVKEKFKSNSSTNLDELDATSTCSGVIIKANKKMNRSASGTDVTEKHLTQLMPIEKLCAILKEKSAKHGVNGVTADVFVFHVFRHHSDLGRRLFNFLHSNSRATTKHLGCIAFRQQSERFLSIIDDSKILECYIKMFAQNKNPDFIDKDGVTRLLDTCYTIAMQQSGNTLICPKINRTFGSVTTSIFFSHDILSIGFVCRWFEQNLIRTVLLLHKYCVHTLSTSYRGVDQESGSFAIDLQAPVLEYLNSLHEKSIDEAKDANASTSLLMPLSQAWLLATALPTLYSKPQKMMASNANKNTAAQIFKDKHSMMPSHWTLLYNSNDNGLGVNRFLHHVLGYKGPTLTLIHLENEQTYMVAAPTEWKETTVYTGGDGSCVLQVLPKFVILENKPNILYLNTYVRGYPKGLRAGSDPKKPIIAIDEHFERVDIKGIATGLLSIEVWGCGDEASREVQLDIRKWQIKEAERQRTVKLTAADWIDHPDRFLLELGGRQTYNN